MFAKKGSKPEIDNTPPITTTNPETPLKFDGEKLPKKNKRLKGSTRRGSTLTAREQVEQSKLPKQIKVEILLTVVKETLPKTTYEIQIILTGDHRIITPTIVMVDNTLLNKEKEKLMKPLIGAKPNVEYRDEGLIWKYSINEALLQHIDLVKEGINSLINRKYKANMIEMQKMEKPKIFDNVEEWLNRLGVNIETNVKKTVNIKNKKGKPKEFTNRTHEKILQMAPSLQDSYESLCFPLKF